MGVRISEFWDLTMAELNAIGKAYKEEKEDEFKYHDELCYRLSGYFYEAESISLHNQIAPMFSKSVRPMKFREMSITQEIEEKKKLENMSVEEKIRRTKQLFDTLSIMQHNFERTHPKKTNEDNPQSS